MASPGTPFHTNQARLAALTAQGVHFQGQGFEFSEGAGLAVLDLAQVAVGFDIDPATAVAPEAVTTQ